MKIGVRRHSPICARAIGVHCVLDRRPAWHRARHHWRYAGSSVGSGFFGAHRRFPGWLCDLLLNTYIKLPKNLQGLMPVLILPVLSTLVVGLLLIFVIGPPMKIINTAMTNC